MPPEPMTVTTSHEGGATLMASDLERWRLESLEGAHRWQYLEKSESRTRPQTKAEKYFLGTLQDTDLQPAAQTFGDAARSGWAFYQSLQLPDGHWACGYGGPSFLLPGLVFAMYITRFPIPPEWSSEMVKYLQTHVNADGGWGLHLEGPSTVLATGLYYTMLRILGLDASHKLAKEARACLLGLGGAIGIPQWGKIWLSCLNLYSWEGIHPIPPEFWLLPDWIPVHPWRWWVQCRAVYLPTSYLYSKRFNMPLNPLLMEIREEIYTQKFSTIDFSKHRSTVAAADIKKPHSTLLKVINSALNFWEVFLRPAWLVRRAQKRVCELMRREDENTDYNDLAPVNKAFQMVAVFCEEGGDSPRVKLHQERLPTYLWLDHEGMTSSGTNGVQVWDTAFSIQAAVEAGLANDPNFQNSLKNALHFMDKSQLDSNLDDPYRQPRKGGWPFSTKDNGYIVSDCAAESLKAVMMLQTQPGIPELISQPRMRDCIDVLLCMQNKDGGFASYEKTRGSSLLEYINPAEVFDRIMVEYSYPECTASVLSTLSHFHKHDRAYRVPEIRRAISRAIRFLEKAQLPNGSWYGAWGICFTYATFLALVGASWTYRTNIRAYRACHFLLDKQRDDGGWGEHYESCETQSYVQLESQVVNTAWATLALMHAECPDKGAIERGLKLIASRQQANGEWKQERLEGVFNRTCMIGYPNYKHYFTVWALGYYENTYLPRWKEVQALDREHGW